mgnify:CR=1 FL=1
MVRLWNKGKIFKTEKMINFKNKIILVTGCNGFIGKAIINTFLKFGAKVIGTDFKKDKSNSKLYHFIKADLNFKSEIKKLHIEILKKTKKIDILINNAGYVSDSEKKETRKVKYFYNEKYQNLNLSNTIYLTNLFIPNLQKSKYQSSIINVCSIYSFLAYDYRLYKNTNIRAPMGYGVSKAGLKHYTKLLSTALAPKIRVNSISPGGIYRKQPREFIKKYIDKTPLSRMGKEQDVVNAIIFFSSDMSSYITGQDLIIDGGYSLS